MEFDLKRERDCVASLAWFGVADSVPLNKQKIQKIVKREREKPHPTAHFWCLWVFVNFLLVHSYFPFSCSYHHYHRQFIITTQPFFSLLVKRNIQQNLPSILIDPIYYLYISPIVGKYHLSLFILSSVYIYVFFLLLFSC